MDIQDAYNAVFELGAEYTDANLNSFESWLYWMLEGGEGLDPTNPGDFCKIAFCYPWPSGLTDDNFNEWYIETGARPLNIFGMYHYADDAEDILAIYFPVFAKPYPSADDIDFELGSLLEADDVAIYQKDAIVTLLRSHWNPGDIVDFYDIPWLDPIYAGVPTEDIFV